VCGILSPFLTHALIKLKRKDCNSPSKYARNAKDAEMQKLQEYSNQSKKDALGGAVMGV
jgi:hypothetical protein